jgi:hypothetical protein
LRLAERNNGVRVLYCLPIRCGVRVLYFANHQTALIHVFSYALESKNVL